MVGLPIVTAAGVVNTHVGPVFVILQQYARHGKGKSIHSSVQWNATKLWWMNALAGYDVVANSVYNT
jgi:hypothetical protein